MSCCTRRVEFIEVKVLERILNKRHVSKYFNNVYLSRVGLSRHGVAPIYVTHFKNEDSIRSIIVRGGANSAEKSSVSS